MISIHLEGMKFYAFHGHFPVEKVTGNNFIVDLRIDFQNVKATVSDELDDTINYQRVYETVDCEMKISSNLLEHVAGRVLDSLYKSFPGILKAEVKISKLNPPMGGEIDKVSVILSR